MMTNKPGKRGVLVVFSGPSGSGKGTILGRVLQERDDTVVSVSATTRAPRAGEIDGVHYFFKTREQVERMIAEDALLEWAQYSDNYYGTPLAFLEENLSAGRNVVLEIEVQGAHKVFEKFPGVASVFICIPSLKVLEQRLRDRGTETDEVVRKRMAAAAGELRQAGDYRYIVMNDDLDRAVRDVHAILDAEGLRSERVINTVTEVLEHA